MMTKRIFFYLIVTGLLLIFSQLCYAQDKKLDNAMLISLRDFGSEDVGYLVIPNAMPKAGLIVVPDSWGLTQELRAVCRELAERGFIIMAVDLYNGSKAENADEAKELYKWVETSTSARAVQTAVNFFKQSPRFQMDKILVVGSGNSSHTVLQAAQAMRERITGITLFHPEGKMNEELFYKLKMPIQVVDEASSGVHNRIRGDRDALPEYLKLVTSQQKYETYWQESEAPTNWGDGWNKAFAFWTSLLSTPQSEGLLNRILE
ncbi:MAG: dienelactone hydrolase family protein [Verrucomicrobiota bacterium]